MTPNCSTLAQRLGVTVHVSPLRVRLANIMREFPSSGAQCLEDWLLDVANARGAWFVTRWPSASPDFAPPVPATLTNEELVVAICQPHNLDRPQMLRAAAQLVSRQAVNGDVLLATSRRERSDLVLVELARQAVHVSPEHLVWCKICHALSGLPTPRSPIIHWTRLAVPIPDERGCNAISWKLVA
ncbi:MAG: hypothetical protein NT011_08305 [Kiritimatiellaeota bacterium]|nr:hypothetical protein [Kiritimatiellota bacterium]